MHASGFEGELKIWLCICMASAASAEGVVRDKMHKLLDSLYFKVGYTVITIGQLMLSVFIYSHCLYAVLCRAVKWPLLFFSHRYTCLLKAVLALPPFSLVAYLINQTLRGEQGGSTCVLLPITPWILCEASESSRSQNHQLYYTTKSLPNLTAYQTTDWTGGKYI